MSGDLGELQVLAVPSGYAELLAWADAFGPVHAFGVEGTGSYGSGLAKVLRRRGRKVVECAATGIDVSFALNCTSSPRAIGPPVRPATSTVASTVPPPAGPARSVGPVSGATRVR